MGIRTIVVGVVPALALVTGCGGHERPHVKKPVKEVVEEKPAPPPPETEADREKKRHAAAVALIPPDTCLPTSLKDAGAPRLEIAAVGGVAQLCAVDTDKSRLLGPVACWALDVRAKSLTYKEPAPLPGHSVDVLLDDHCARGYCLPSEAKVPGDRVAHMAWGEAEKPAEGEDAAAAKPGAVAVLVGDDVHLFDGATKAHTSAFTIRGDKGAVGDATAVHLVGDEVFVEASDGTASGVWVFKAADGSPVGPITALGAKESAPPVSTHGGAFVALDKARVAVIEQGYAQMTVFEIASGKRTKAVRKALKAPCKPAEIDAFWKGADKVTDKCRDALVAETTPWVGADALAGAKNLLVVLHGERTGELAVVDPRSLAEDKAKTIKLPFCGAGAAAAAPSE